MAKVISTNSFPVANVQPRVHQPRGCTSKDDGVSTIEDDSPAPGESLSHNCFSSPPSKPSTLMDLPATSRLYNDAISAAKFADERLEARTRTDYTGSLRRFAAFCEREGYPNPLKQRFTELPGVIAAYIHHLATINTSQWPAEKLRAALSWHYTKPEMLTGGHPHDRWTIETTADGRHEPRGNPARSAMISQILAGLSKVKKRERTPTRASPMSLPMLSRMLTYLESDDMFNETMRSWFAAVCSLCFFGMCRINEVLMMKRGDIQLGLQRKSRKTREVIRYGFFTIRDRKTDHDPLASRTYSLHHLPKEEHAAEALTHVDRWFVFASSQLHHKWCQDDFAFPSLMKIPRGSTKRKRFRTSDSDSSAFAKVAVKWGSAMSDNNFTQILNIVADAAGISRNLLGDEVWFTSHCFRRGGAQYRFMFAPEKRRWSLKLVKWWAGWAQNEQAETVVRYLLDDVLDREESQLGDSLAPDTTHPFTTCLDGGIDDDNDINLVAHSGFTKRSDEKAVAGAVAVDNGADIPNATASFLSDLKTSLIEELRGIVKTIHDNQDVVSDVDSATQRSLTTTGECETSHLMSELPDARSWRDYVKQYWTSNPACHQYRAGVDMLPHERKAHRSRLSRMKIIAEFIRDVYKGDLDRFEGDFRRCVGEELTVNRILSAIRERRNRKSV
jgi:integrase